jgi:periplasmic divalent cation tolerance protein
VADAIDAMTAHVRAIHPYENFELIALPIEGGSTAYLQWLVESVNGPPEA